MKNTGVFAPILAKGSPNEYTKATNTRQDSNKTEKNKNKPKENKGTREREKLTEQRESGNIVEEEVRSQYKGTREKRDDEEREKLRDFRCRKR